MEGLKTELKNCLKVYRDIDDEARVLNKHVYELREKKKLVEVKMADILKDPYMSHVGLLKLENDNSSIKIQRPGTYSKPWSLSKRDLQSYLQEYFDTKAGHNANAQDCVEFILQQQKAHAVETDFKFTRNIPNENMDIE